MALTTIHLAPLLILVAALTHPNVKAAPKLPASAWVPIAIAAGSSVFVLTAVDSSLALFSRINWAVLVVAAIACARVLDPRRQIRQLITTLAMVGLIVLGISVAQILLEPGTAWDGAYTRFSPFGLNPNSLGPTLAVGVGAMLLDAQRRALIGRAFMLGSAAAGVGVLVLTSSRGNLLLLSFAVLPVVLFALRRRPARAVVATGALMSAAWWIVGRVEASRFARLETLESARGELAARYFAEVKERPFFGLLFSEGERAQTLIGLELDEHNAYLRILYLGGLTLFIPLALVSLVALRRASRLPSSVQTEDRAAAWFLVSVFVGMFVYGWTNRLMYEPTGYWPFLHMVLLGLMLIWLRDVPPENLDESTRAPDALRPGRRQDQREAV